MIKTQKNESNKLYNYSSVLANPKKILCTTKFKYIISSFKTKNTPQKITNQIQPTIEQKPNLPANKLNHQNMPTALSCEPPAKLVDTINANIGALAQASSWPADEINRLIKKMTLSFSAQKNESSFYIKNGIFNGAQFILHSQEQDLCLVINQANNRAKALVRQEKHLLATKLKKHEINLRSIQFLS